MAKQPLTNRRKEHYSKFQLLDSALLTQLLNEGYTASEDGQPREANPYPHFTSSWHAWDKGWSDCDTHYQEELQSVSYTTTIGTAIVIGAAIGIALWLLFTS